MTVRHFKFKAWDLVDKKMIGLENGVLYQPNPTFNPEEEITATNAPHFLEFWEEPLLPCVIMQFTGRQDIKGVDIYDYDIVKWNFAKFDFDTNSYNQKEKISYVEYLDRGFRINNESFGWEGEDLWNWDKIEVIGNLFEHPERYYLDK